MLAIYIHIPDKNSVFHVDYINLYYPIDYFNFWLGLTSNSKLLVSIILSRVPSAVC